MMNALSTILIGALLLVHQAICDDVPSVKSIDCSETQLPSDTFEECLVITQNEENVFAGLNGFRESDQSLQGSLYSTDGEEFEDTWVSVTKQDDEDAHVIIILLEDDKQVLFEMDCKLATGECEDYPVTIGSEGEVVDQVMEVPESDRLKERKAPLNRQETILQFPPQNGFKMKVQIMYDLAFAAKYNNDVDQIKRAIDGVLVHANAYFKLKSLLTKFELDTTGLPYHPLQSTYTASDSNLNLLAPIVRSFPREANVYTILSYENDMGGTAGIAWKGTACMYDRGYRVNINEYMVNDMKSAAILVHEIGHNLGMAHDFGTKADGHTNTNVVRYDEVGKKCSQVEGFMDYYGKTTRWSPCSVQDFVYYYTSVYNSQQQWCMPQLSKQ